MSNKQTTLFEYQTTSGYNVEICYNTNIQAPHKEDGGLLFAVHHRKAYDILGIADAGYETHEALSSAVSKYIAKGYTVYTIISLGKKLCITDNPEYITKHTVIGNLLFPKEWVHEWCEHYGDCYDRATEVFMLDMKFIEYGALNLYIENANNLDEVKYLYNYYGTENPRHDLINMLNNFKLKDGMCEEILGYARKIHHPYFG